MVKTISDVLFISSTVVIMYYVSAGGMSLHYQQWMATESNQLILSWIKNGVQIPFVSKPEPFISHNRLLSTSEEIFVDNEIKDLLSSGAI